MQLVFTLILGQLSVLELVAQGNNGDNTRLDPTIAVTTPERKLQCDSTIAIPLHKNMAVYY